MKLLKYNPIQKITYSAGLISLTLLPILCLCWLYHYEISKKKHAIDIVIWSSDAKESVPQDYWLETILKKKHTAIKLTGNNTDDTISLKYAEVLLKRWKMTKDDAQLIDFQFGKKAKYWTFVEAINVCKNVDLPNYIAYENNMYAFWNFHPKPVENKTPMLFCGTSFTPVDLKQIPIATSWKDTAMIIVTDYWLPSIVFIFMLALTVVKSYKQNFRLKKL